MGIEQEFAHYGAKLANRMWAVSALTEEPRQLVVSIWQHHIQEVDGRWVYDDSVGRWKGPGRNLLKEHLAIALRESLPLRVVMSTMLNRAEVLADPDKAPRNKFKARPEWIGRVDLLDGDRFVLVFEQMADGATFLPALSSSAKYWRVAEAVDAMGGGTAAEISAWLGTHYPDDPIADLRANLEHLTVNSRSRPHYDYARTNWRSDTGHPRDRLFKVDVPGSSNRVRYVPFNPAVHGHVDLRKNDDGKWEVFPLEVDEQARLEAQGQSEALAHAPPIDSDHDARVWAMRAVAQRRGQPLFRAQLLDAYGGGCAITGCTALEVLEAAHIVPYRGEHTHRVDNGLLLRADLHTLFDCQLLWITSEHTVELAPSLMATDYAVFAGQPINLPDDRRSHPNPAHLAEHAQRCRAR